MNGSTAIHTLNNGFQSFYCYDDLILFASPDKFYIQSFSSSSNVLTIDRTSTEIKVERIFNQIPSTCTRKQIAAVMGVVRLICGSYLVIVTEKVQVGIIGGDTIWQIVKTEIISFLRSDNHLSDQEKESNLLLLRMLQETLAMPHTYFAYRTDLTQTRQRFYQQSGRRLSMGIGESFLSNADERFFWNKYLLNDFINIPESHLFCVVVVFGAMFIVDHCCLENVPSGTFKLALFSRRSTHRVGTRLFARGLDSEGNVANFVETEQIVEMEDGTGTYSYVQTRGSIPIFWSQLPNLRYKPRLSIDATEKMELERAFARHVEEQIKFYGHQTIVNLASSTGDEGDLGRLLCHLAANYTTKSNSQNLVKYVAFDFHAECQELSWNSLQTLINKLSESVQRFGYFSNINMTSHPENILIELQRGVFRTNCIDCLDRTNVVQSLLANDVLENILISHGILSSTGGGPKLADENRLNKIFRNLWADNADLLSQQYAGSNALKTDFTRTGRRTWFGLVSDGKKSLYRYFKNNFCDGFRQDGLDFFTGHFNIDNHGHPNLCRDAFFSHWFHTLPLAILVCIAMCFGTFIFSTELSLEVALFFSFWLLAAIIVAVIIFLCYPKEFVDYPRLLEKKRL